VSRSRRKMPIHGVTTAESEKQEKRAYNRRYRHAVKQAVQSGDDETPLPIVREYSDPWAMGKDGKMLFDPAKHPAIMRK